MLHPATFQRFEDAYTAVLEHVGVGYQQTIGARGNNARECLNISFVLDNPRDRIVYTPARRTNIVFCFAEALWYFWGRDDLDMIGYYAPSIAKVSADGTTLTGSAYGPKIFKPSLSRGSQWDRIIRVLTDEPDSKRAVVSIFGPEELLDPANPNVSCTLGMQFLLRKGFLHAVTYMRGNDAVIGLLNDVFSATLIQEFTAAHLGVKVGSYGHHVGSMHINDVDNQLAAQVAATAHHDHARFPIMTMPRTGWAELLVVEHYEQALRRDEQQLNLADAAWQSLHPYWQQVVLLFEIYRQIIHYPGTPIWAATLKALAPAYRWLVGNRWPQVMTNASVVREEAR
ncbi:thymidylate synthase [Streptosporangium sp. NPDC006007]|uniref:thymidylate synthase n=1 Tax=Streptosporangium sp. NPDC006007 TaxID=3154575 RepID=UPI0033A4F5FC